MTFPDLEALVHYTTVRRGVTREHMLTNQSALDAIQAGEPVPTGTHFVLVDYQSDVPDPIPDRGKDRGWPGRLGLSAVQRGSDDQDRR